MDTRLEKAWTSVLLVGVVALSVQAYQLGSLRTDPSVKGPIIDALVYHREAERLVRGQPAPRAPHWQSPLFPWLLSAAYRVTGVVPARGLWLQAALGVLVAILVLGIGRVLLPPRWALAAGLVACGYGPLLFFCGQLIPARRKSGDLAGAEQALRKAVEALPDSARAQYHLARCLVDQGRRDEALPILRYAAERWPNFRASRNLLRRLERPPSR
jgi:tetratricopeptide (TPR) repeat protein